LYPLHDTTEARYAEIARVMVASGDWVTPQIAVGVPFWAKPPLSIWFTAASFELFGLSEFAARFPVWVLILLVAALVVRLGKVASTTDAAVASAAVFLTTVLGFMSAGMVMTDAALTLSTTLSLASFWMAADFPASRWRYLFFVGLGLGLLAKGPLALVLVGLPVLTWALWHRGIVWLCRALPWVSGSLLMLAIAGPWYWLAETRTPGFLEYFFVGEHLLRFIQSGWEGDLYGSAHAHPKGYIWIYGFAAALPWTVVALVAAGSAIRKRSVLASLSPFETYLLLWLLAPLVFFTLAGNILPAYVLPGLPAFALLIGPWVLNRRPSLALLGVIVPGVLAMVLLAGIDDSLAGKTQKYLVQYHRESAPASPLYYFPKTPYSASFYSRGKTETLKSENDLATLIASGNSAFLAVKKTQLAALDTTTRRCLNPDRTFSRYLLLQINSACTDRK
ncbi:MAG: glycosyltransferase family 39 protein, partial [Gammaproteobacteria bacterium]|nr:glycosyltransferase family 39 protein [Gammaproteobacteria bacterium]